MSLKDRLRVIISWDNALIVGLLGILLWLLWQIWLFTLQFTEDFSERVALLNVGTSAVLSMVLIGVYVKMARDSSRQTRQMEVQVDSMEDQSQKMERQLESMERQTESMEQQTKQMEIQADFQEQVVDIQKGQQRLMEAQYRPELVLQETFEADGDTLKLELANNGTGLAKNIGLDIEFLVNEADSNTKLTPIENREEGQTVEDRMRGEIILVEGFETMSHSLSRSSESRTPAVDAGTVLPAGETDELTSTVQLWYYSGEEAVPGDGHPVGFSSAVGSLQNMGVEVLAYRIKLTYQNILDEEHPPQQLAEGAVHLSEDPDLQDLLDARHTTGIIDWASYPLGSGGLRAEFHLPRF